MLYRGGLGREDGVAVGTAISWCEKAGSTSDVVVVSCVRSWRKVGKDCLQCPHVWVDAEGMTSLPGVAASGRVVLGIMTDCSHALRMVESSARKVSLSPGLVKT